MESHNNIWTKEYIQPDLIIIIIVGIRTRNETNKKYHHIILILSNGITIGRPMDSGFVFSSIPVSMKHFYCHMNVSKNNFSVVFASNSQRGSLYFIHFSNPTTAYIYTFRVTYCLKTKVKVILMYKNKDSLFSTLWLC